MQKECRLLHPQVCIYIKYLPHWNCWCAAQNSFDLEWGPSCKMPIITQKAPGVPTLNTTTKQTRIMLVWMMTINKYLVPSKNCYVFIGLSISQLGNLRHKNNQLDEVVLDCFTYLVVDITFLSKLSFEPSNFVYFVLFTGSWSCKKSATWKRGEAIILLVAVFYAIEKKTTQYMRWNFKMDYIWKFIFIFVNKSPESTNECAVE